MEHLLDDPHHDGSPLYLSDEAPALGSDVLVRVRTSTLAPTAAVWLRNVEDAEPFYTALEVGRPGRPTRCWWQGRLHLRNPVQHYRFLVVTGPRVRLAEPGRRVRPRRAGRRRLRRLDVRRRAGLGPRRGGLPDLPRPVRPLARPPTTGRCPTGRSRRRGTTEPIHGGRRPEALELYGGDLDGVAEHLDHVARLGADTLYLTPIVPGREQPPLQRLDLRPRSTRCSAATTRADACSEPPTSAACGSSAT